MGIVGYPTIRYKKIYITYTLIYFDITLTSKLLECTSLGVTGVRSGHLLIRTSSLLCWDADSSF